MNHYVQVKCPSIEFGYIYFQEFPIISKLDPAVYGPPESAITKELIEQELNGMSVEKVLISKCMKIEKCWFLSFFLSFYSF